MKKLTTILCLLFTLSAFAQTTITLPKASPKGEVTQTIGLTDITVVYHSPSVKGRTVWGGLVPYDKVWRAGANENTTISFSHEVSINDKKVPAGIYGLHMIPGKDKWTVILSKNHTSWGSYFYKEEEDALRVEVTPKEHQHTEWLTYTFLEKSSNSATLSLLWEKLEIPIKIDVDVNAVVFANMKNELRSIPGFTWEGYYAAADFCYKNSMETEQALKWINRAERFSNNNFNVMKLKSFLLVRSGKDEEAKKIMEKAIEFASEEELNTYGYDLLNYNKVDDALEIFKINVKRHPKSWNAQDSYGEALAKKGSKNDAIKAYKKALKNNPPKAQEKRISKTITELEG
jgi:hypothetical protein